MIVEQSRGPGRAATVSLVGASALASLDLFIANLAYPAVTAHFADVPPAVLSWVLNGYVVALAAVMIPGGSIANRIGRARLFKIGLLLHILGALTASTSPTVGILIAARALQGVGAALIVPTSLALLLATFPPARHKAMVTVWAATGSVAAGLGPALGGLVAETSWRWVFVLSLPISLTALVCSRALRSPADRHAPLPDLIGSGLLAAAIASLVLILTRIRTITTDSTAIAVLAAAGIAAFIVFVVRCRTRPVPALDLGLLRVPTLRLGIIGMAIYHVGFTGVLLGGSLYLVHIWHWSTPAAGAAYAVGPITAALAALIAGRAALPAPAMAMIGGAALTATGVIFLTALTGPTPVPAAFFTGMILWGISAGLSQPGLITAGVSDLTQTAYSTGTATLNTARQIGSAAGNALVVAILGTGTTLAAYPDIWIVIITAATTATAVGAGLLHITRTRTQAAPALA